MSLAKLMGVPFVMVDVEIKSYHLGTPNLRMDEFIKSHDRIMRLFNLNKNGVESGVTT
jgi:hypothetical protein